VPHVVDFQNENVDGGLFDFDKKKDKGFIFYMGG